MFVFWHSDSFLCVERQQNMETLGFFSYSLFYFLNQIYISSSLELNSNLVLCCCTQWLVQRSLTCLFQAGQAPHRLVIWFFPFCFPLSLACGTPVSFSSLNALNQKEISLNWDFNSAVILKSMLPKQTRQWKGILKVNRALLSEPSMARRALTAYGWCINYRFK